MMRQLHFVRYVPTRSQKKGADGKKLCLVCEGPLPPRRSSYCGDECALRNNPGFIRQHVKRRDRGVCAVCGLDTNAIPRDARGYWMHHRWEADHIVPVSEGGGLCGLEGYRTLCKGPGTNNCHGKASGELRKRLNEAAKAEKAQKEAGRLFA